MIAKSLAIYFWSYKNPDSLKWKALGCALVFFFQSIIFSFCLNYCDKKDISVNVSVKYMDVCMYLTSYLFGTTYIDLRRTCFCVTCKMISTTSLIILKCSYNSFYKLGLVLTLAFISWLFIIEFYKYLSTLEPYLVFFLHPSQHMHCQFHFCWNSSLRFSVEFIKCGWMCSQQM